MHARNAWSYVGTVRTGGLDRRSGTFDGIFLTAILAVLIADLPPALPAEDWKVRR